MNQFGGGFRISLTQIPKQPGKKYQVYQWISLVVDLESVSHRFQNNLVRNTIKIWTLLIAEQITVIILKFEQYGFNI